MRTIYFDGGVLNAMANLSAKKDIRYYLNGVLLEVSNSIIRIVATDGHLLGVYQQSNKGGDEGEFFKIIIPNEVISKLEKKVLQHTLTTDGYKCEIDNIGFSAIDGTFPDYMRVFPTGKVSGEIAQFNPDFIARFTKVGKALGMKNPMPTIGHNGTGTALVDIGKPDYFAGLMMPYKTEHTMFSTPAWLTKMEVQKDVVTKQ